MRCRTRVWATALALLAAAALSSQARDAAPMPLADALASVRFVAYTPRGFDPLAGGADVLLASLRADLAVLRARFDGLVTYSSRRGLDAVPRLARELGFRALVLGVWDPGDAGELERAFAAARAEPGIVVALTLGNEGLFFRRYDAATLGAAFARARRELPGVALATSEPFHLYLDPARAAQLPAQDLLLPVVHPLDQPWFGHAPAETPVEFVANVVRDLETRYHLPVLVKETGVPSGPAEDGFSESAQAGFWRALRARLPASRAHAVAAFEAFDAPWKIAEVERQTGDRRAHEAHWGFFRADGSPKPAATGLSELAQ